MDFKELTEERYSVRNFSSEKVKKEDLNFLLNVAKVSPTAVNNQPQRILVLESVEALTKLKECTPCHFNAPLALIVFSNKNEAWVRSFDNFNHNIIDGSIVATHIMLGATERGLGTTWVGHFDPKIVKEKFNVPDELEPVCILPLGYPSEDAKPSERHFQRKDISEVVFYDSL